MNGCVFLPASGYHSDNGGTLFYKSGIGYIWSSMSVSANSNWGYFLSFTNTMSNPEDNNGKVYGFNVRCVK